MKSLERHLAQYAAYHRDARNVATHFLGIPLIVVGIATLLSRPAISLGALPLSATTVVVLGSALFYLRLDVRLGLVMTALFVAAASMGAFVAALSTALWLAVGLGCFVVGWIVQLVGHVFEGRKPAFLDDLVGLLVGPLFLVVEVAVALGLRQELKTALHPDDPPPRGSRLSRSAS
jgi:uncharacterized membrane protein YGL010W